MNFFNKIFYIISYPLNISKNFFLNIYDNYLPSILNIEEFIWSEETAWIVGLIGSSFILVEFYLGYKLYQYYYPNKEDFLNKNFFYFKMPTETNLGIYVGPLERDLLTYNCLLTRSLAGRLDQKNSKYLQKIPYERISYLQEETLLHKKLINSFDFKILKKEELLNFFKIKEKIINEKFYSYQLHHKKLLNKDWYHFKGYYVKSEDNLNIIEHLNYLNFFYTISFFTITIFILFIFTNKIYNKNRTN